MRYPTYPRSEKPALHMQPRGAGLRYMAERSCSKSFPLKSQETLYSLTYLRRSSTRSGLHDLTFGVFILLTFLADLDSPIFSSEEAFRFVVLTGTTSTSSKTDRYIRLIITLHECNVSYFRTFFDDIVVDVYKVISAKKLATLVLISHVVLAGFGAIQNSKIIAQMNITPPHPQHSHEENLRHLSGLPGTADRATRLGEVPHLSCESSQEKKRDCMERLVTSPRWGTSPTWGPPPPCEQALLEIQTQTCETREHRVCHVMQVYFS